MIEPNPVFQSNNTQSNKDVEDESHAHEEYKDTLELVLPVPKHHRVELNGISKVQVTYENKSINACVIIVKIGKFRKQAIKRL